MMAYYYSSNFYKDDFGEYHQTPYSSSYDVVAGQDSIAYSAYEFSDCKSPISYDASYDVASYQNPVYYTSYESHEPKFIEYNPSAYDPYFVQSRIGHSTYNFSEPKLIQYEPKYIISYSTSEFSEPESAEYDPTPYDGGYDISLTYGKPLLPSDEICYPHSMPESNGLSLDGFSYGSIPSPYGKVDSEDSHSAKPSNGSKPTGAKGEEKQSNGDQHADSVEDHNLEKPSDLSKSEERGEHTNGDECPKSEFDYGYGNGTVGGYGYGGEGQVPQYAYGYGLEAMDLCECLFGHWPCLSRRDERSNGHQKAADEESYSYNNPWKGAADYLFGSPYGYGEQRNGGAYHGDYFYGR